MKNETAIITGSTSGIGLSIAEKFLEAGCNVTISSRSEDKVKNTLAELTKKYKDSVIGFACDVNDPKALKKLVDKTIEKFGSVRILIANAGTNRTYGPFSNLTADMVSKDAITVIGTNLIGTLNSIAAVMPHMIQQKYGRIITLSGAGAERPMENIVRKKHSETRLEVKFPTFSVGLKLIAQSSVLHLLVSIKVSLLEPCRRWRSI